MTVPSPLDALCQPGGPLNHEPPDAAEFEGLVRSGETRLADASRFDLAYNAAHAMCLAALRHAGYRSTKRHVVFQALPHTLGLGPEVWRVLDRTHRARNLSEYEGDLSIDERLLDDMIHACQLILAALRKLPPI